MSTSGENIHAKAHEVNNERHWNHATRILVGFTVFSCFLCAPAVMRANIFTDMIGAVKNIGNYEGNISKNMSSIHNYNISVVAPVNQLTSMRKWLISAASSYKSWYNSVLNVRVHSASMSGPSSFESTLRSGMSGGRGSSISGAYSSVYGTRLSSKSANTSMATTVDAYDSAAQEGMTLAAKSDNASMQLISTANSLQTMAASSAPGTASQVAAESQALQLQSVAMQHHVLASMLRQEATRLAATSARSKSTSANHSIVVRSFFGGSK
jgi:hypothetical protein